MTKLNSHQINAINAITQVVWSDVKKIALKIAEEMKVLNAGSLSGAYLTTSVICSSGIVGDEDSGKEWLATGVLVKTDLTNGVKFAKDNLNWSKTHSVGSILDYKFVVGEDGNKIFLSGEELESLVVIESLLEGLSSTCKALPKDATLFINGQKIHLYVRADILGKFIEKEVEEVVYSSADCGVVKHRKVLFSNSEEVTKEEMKNKIDEFIKEHEGIELNDLKFSVDTYIDDMSGDCSLGLFACWTSS